MIDAPLISRAVAVRTMRMTADEGLWNDFVEHQPDATLYHDLRWKQVMEKSFPHPVYCLMAMEGDEVSGILPLVLVRSIFFGRQLVSLPFVDVAGICATHANAAEALWNHAVSLSRELRGGTIELRQCTPFDLPVAPSTHKVSMRLSLAGRSDQQWKSLDAKVRNQVRKAEKSGLRSEWGGEEHLDAFYDVFSRNMRDLGSPVHSRRFFKNILRVFQKDARICVIRAAGRVCAGAIALRSKDEVAVPWASSLREYREHCPNMLLYWTIIRDACDSGALVFDFGRSSPDGGTYRFKKQWGAQASPLHWYTWPDAKSKLPNRQFAERLWSRLPLWMANSLGPAARKHIPL